MRRLILAAGLLLAACVPAGQPPAPTVALPDERACVGDFLVRGTGLAGDVAAAPDVTCDSDRYGATLTAANVNENAKSRASLAATTLAMMVTRIEVPVGGMPSKIADFMTGVSFPGFGPSRVVVPERRDRIGGVDVTHSTIAFVTSGQEFALVCVVGGREGRDTLIAMVCRGEATAGLRGMRGVSSDILARDFPAIRW